MNEQQMLDILTTNHIPAVISGYEDDMADGEITILGSHLHVQVGSQTGFQLCQALYDNPTTPDQLTGVVYYQDTADNLNKLIARIKELR